MESSLPLNDFEIPSGLMAVASAWLESDAGADDLMSRLGRLLGYAHGRTWARAADGWVRAVARWDEDNSGDPPETLAAHRLRLRTLTLGELVWRDCRPLATDAIPSDAGLGALHSALVMPLFADSTVYGVLGLYSEQERAISDSALEHVAVIARAVGRRLLQREPGLDGRLSPREIEVLQLAAAGHGNLDIADRLFVSPATVKTHLAHIFEKLEAPDRASAVAHALRAGLIE